MIHFSHYINEIYQIVAQIIGLVVNSLNETFYGKTVAIQTKT